MGLSGDVPPAIISGVDLASSQRLDDLPQSHRVKKTKKPKNAPVAELRTSGDLSHMSFATPDKSISQTASTSRVKSSQPKRKRADSQAPDAHTIPEETSRTPANAPCSNTPCLGRKVTPEDDSISTQTSKVVRAARREPEPSQPPAMRIRSTLPASNRPGSPQRKKAKKTIPQSTSASTIDWSNFESSVSSLSPAQILAMYSSRDGANPQSDINPIAQTDLTVPKKLGKRTKNASRSGSLSALAESKRLNNKANTCLQTEGLLINDLVSSVNTVIPTETQPQDATPLPAIDTPSEISRSMDQILTVEKPAKTPKTCKLSAPEESRTQIAQVSLMQKYCHITPMVG